MELWITGTPEEIAAFVLAIQERRSDHENVLEQLSDMVDRKFEADEEELRKRLY